MKNFFFRWILIWLWFSLTLLLFIIWYAAINVIWTNPSTLEVSDNSTLTAESWNKLLWNFQFLKGKVDTFNEVPIWTILAWHKNMAWVPSLPNWWVECNGSIINDIDSPLNWQSTPNLNNQVYHWWKWYYLRWWNTSWLFNPSSAWDDNGNAYTTSFWSRYWSATAAFRDLENSDYKNSYNTIALNPNDYRFQVAAMTVVYIIKIK